MRYQLRRRDDSALRARVRELAAKYPRYGYRMLTDKLRQEGQTIGFKRVYRLYSEEQLQLPKRRRKKLRSVTREPLAASTRCNECWSLDFMSDMLGDGRRFRTLNVLDNFSRECLAIDVAVSIPGARVVRVLEAIAERRGYPATLLCDNGPEFTGRDLDRWASAHGVSIHFIQPGKPTQNAFIESFNDKFRSEMLSAHWFTNLADARRKIGDWVIEYNEERPHSSIGRIPPAAFARQAGDLRPPTATSAPLLEGLRPTQQQEATVQLSLGH